MCAPAAATAALLLAPLACNPAAEQFGNKAPFTPIDPGLCADADPNCEGWAKSGECERNARFMTGDLGNPGACSLSCGGCKPCAKVRALSGAALSCSSGMLLLTAVLLAVHRTTRRATTQTGGRLATWFTATTWTLMSEVWL